MTNIVVTILNEKDAESYWNLRLEALKEAPDAFLTSYDEALQRVNPVEQVAQQLSSEESITFGAFSEDSLVGVTTLKFTDKEKERHKAFLLAMYVTPQYQNHGIAKQLIFKAIQTARRHGEIEQIHLSVVSINPAAIHLYESIGFKAYATEPRALKTEKGYLDECLMVLSL
ncbi:Ribosomal protein S18 acetylase RimI [Salinibacillus kushneri]|uniref:Ribosomal protein S18 acetylase RimI n=1 Tax=Salinibacillus kushneri TaxID=237682 RepID=A0A1I0BD09_9BACI|nr:GNAT family N-acetyltransferase [Salinibacillus kushneri]SET04033.1 Ribosomal protein S18 acetylase RimI [Salinibacillus kushneri]